MPIVLFLVSSGLVLLALLTLKGLSVVANLSEAVEVVDHSPWEGL
jgi:hypothetical protein